MTSLSEKFAQGLLSARLVILVLFLGVTAFLTLTATGIRVSADISKMIPLGHPYIQNFLEHQSDVELGNDIRIILKDVRHDDIFNDDYVQVLKQLTDEVLELQGVDPTRVSSLWTPDVRWNEVTEEGFQGGDVVPNDYDGSEQSIELLRTNVLRSGQVGRLVADDFRSSIVYAGLLDVFGDDGKIDIPTLSASLEEIRDRYEAEYPFVRIHMVGVAKKVADVMDASREVAMMFFVAILLMAVLLFGYTRCLRSSLVVVFCSFVAVLWQLGIITMLGFTIDPYSMLVPFLVFAIACSHGVQVVNSFINNRSTGKTGVEAAVAALALLLMPGMVALISDGVGFLTLYVIDIGVIRELALSASVGIAAIIITNLLVLPLLLSYVGTSQGAIRRAQVRGSGDTVLVRIFSRFSSRGMAAVSILIAVLGGAAGLWLSQDLKIGDLDRGAPELWPDPCETQDCAPDFKPANRYRYNHDTNVLVSNYSVSADVLVIMGVTPVESCNSYEAITTIDDLAWVLRNTHGVQDVLSIATVTKMVATNMNEGSLKWRTISRDPYVLNSAMNYVPRTLYNMDCSLTSVYVFLDDHKAETLNRVTSVVEEYEAANPNKDVITFKLASGNAGIDAATNQMVEQSQTPMLVLVYSVVIAACLIAFRSLAATVCIVVPLALTSILCQALMAQLGIGVKVATLPVIALGVGIGVDYGIYIYSRLSWYLKQGLSLDAAYRETLKTTGAAVAFTGIALSIGVVLWVFSSIKFQADMGILLTFMFLWNMVGALWLLPALARFLLKERVRAKDAI